MYILHSDKYLSFFVYVFHSDRYLGFFLSKVRIPCDLKIMYYGADLTGFCCYNSSIRVILGFGLWQNEWFR
jgi:hypothetical protein